MINHQLTKTQDHVSTQDSIVLFIKKNKEVTVQELCDYLKITSMAVRRHLNVLHARRGGAELKRREETRMHDRGVHPDATACRGGENNCSARLRVK